MSHEFGDELDAYADTVLHLVEQVSPGFATTYGDIAELMRDAGWGGGPRTVGAAMARYGSSVAWWRVVRADGGLPRCDVEVAAHHHRIEGTPMRGIDRVDLTRARATLPQSAPRR